MKWFFALLFFSCSLFAKEESVLLAILARNKAHTLPRYLKCIENLEYNKKSITVYINTNNNIDETETILRTWAKKNEHLYQNIVFENHNVKHLKPCPPHAWNAERFKVLQDIRNKSMRLTKSLGCDYYFVVDCDNFIAPETLSHLMAQKKPIVAPLLRAIPEIDDAYSNFFCDVLDNGYYKNHPDYYRILNRNILGTFEVPVVHCTYLIDANYIDSLSYADGTADYEFIIFSRVARKNGVKQFICNEKEFGVLVHMKESKTLAEEKRWLESILTLP